MTDDTKAPERIIFGQPFRSGHVWHAVPDRYRDPDDHRVTEFGPGVHSGDPQPWLRSATALCGRRNEAHFGWFRVIADEDFSPAGPAGKGQVPCYECVQVWSAVHAIPVPGWEKQCRECEQTKPASSFRADKRTADGLTADCEVCRQKLKRASSRAAEVRRQDEYRERLEATFTAQAEKTADLLNRVGWLKFTCDAGHTIQAVAAGPGVAWLCGCGLAPIDSSIVVLAHTVQDLGFADIDPRVVQVASRSDDQSTPR